MTDLDAFEERRLTELKQIVAARAAATPPCRGRSRIRASAGRWAPAWAAVRQPRHRVWVAVAAGTMALLVGAGVIMAAVEPSRQPPRQPSRPAIQPVALSSDTTLRTDLGSSFPRHLVAAGHTAVAAYYTVHKNPVEGDKHGFAQKWYLYNPASGTYEPTPWAFADVRPGMRQAVVVEGPLPATRVGILDTSTQKVTRWIPVGHPVSGAYWSPDGSRLLLTAYETPDPPALPIGRTPRTGFYVVDAASGRSSYHALAASGMKTPVVRDGLHWSRSGTLIWERLAPANIFYDLSGRPHPAPAHEAESGQDAGLSPNGTLLPKFGSRRHGPGVTVTNVTTGKRVAELPIEQASAWADDTQLFALACAEKNCASRGEFYNRLILIDLDGKITPLTGYHQSDKPGAWQPVFTHR